MHCLDTTAATERPNTHTIDRVRSRGGVFAYSDALSEWVIIVRDDEVKSRLRARYGPGVGVYTLAEIRALEPMPAEDLRAVHECVVGLGATVEETE